MWSDESRFPLFQSDGGIRVRREADEVMQPSCLVSTVQACAMGQCYDLGLGSLADYLNILNEQLIPSMDHIPR